jgi:hypothetical protein
VAPYSYPNNIFFLIDKRAKSQKTKIVEDKSRVPHGIQIRLGREGNGGIRVPKRGIRVFIIIINTQDWI